MARKKKRPARNKKSRPAAKAKRSGSKTRAAKPAKSSTTKSSTTKSSTTKSSATKSSATKSSTTNRSSSPKRGATSVDSLLQKFDKDRTQKEARLSVMQKKRTELQEKTKKLQEQIAKVSQQISETEVHISQLDSQRDAEVKELLTKLGVRIDAAQATPVASGSTGHHSPASGDRGKVDRESLTFANGREE